MATLPGFEDRRPHQRAADALALMGGIDCKRAKEQRRDGTVFRCDAGLDIPEPNRADDMAGLVSRDKCEAFGRNAVPTDRLGRLAAAVRTHGGVEQALAGQHVARILPVDAESGFGFRREERADRIKNSGHRGLPYSTPL